MEQEKKSLEQMFAELDEISRKLESTDISLKDSVECYGQGIQLLKECTEELDLTEKQLMKLNEDGSLDVIEETV